MNKDVKSLEIKCVKSLITGSEFTAENIGILVLYLSVVLEILIVIIDKSNYTNPIEGQLFRVTFLLASMKVLLTKYTKKEWLVLIAFGLLGLVSYKLTGRNEILRIVVFVAACKNVDMKRLLKLVFYMTLSGCMLLILLSVSGIYGRLALEADFGRGYVQTRYCLGIGHPNALHCMFLMLAALGLYLYNDKMRWYYYIILFLLNYGLFVLTDSNTGFLMSTCVIAGAFIVRYWKGLRKQLWAYGAGVAVLLFCVVFSVLVADSRVAKPENYWFASRWVAEAETHLNGRIMDLYYGSIDREGTTATWSLFSVPENHYYFDMGFVRLFYWYGIIPAIIYTVLQVLLIRQFYKKKDAMGLVVITVFAVYTVVEAHLVSVYIGRNYILFFMGMYMSGMLGLRSEKEENILNAWKLLDRRYS
ncbi:MAG: hypothetical protein GX235_07735 [Clostridiales bacterium]|nr:hypothetical protein [Clostridiales bacterium]